MPSMVFPRVAETNTPQPMDATGECLLYADFMVGILPGSNRSQKVEVLIFIMEKQDGNPFKRSS